MNTTKKPLKLRPVTNSPSTEGVYHLRNDDQGYRIGLVYERKHAVRIVTAVNNFDEMVAVIERLINNNGTGAMEWAISEARAALAKVKS